MGLFDDLLEDDSELDSQSGINNSNQLNNFSQKKRVGLFDDLLEEPEEEKPEEQGILRQVADIPLGIARGGVTGIKMMTDILGADNTVSKSLAGVEGYMADLMSAQAKEDQQEISRIMKDAEDKGFGEQVKAGIKAFSIAPVDIMSQALGTMAPVVATGLVGSAAKLGVLGMRAVQAGVGAGMGAGMIKGEIYNEVKNELVNSGITEDAAEKTAIEAQSYGGKNLDQILLGAGLGAASTIGAEGIITRILTKQGTAPAAGVVSRVLKGGLTEAVPEAAQAAQEQLAKNVALQREGFDIDPSRGIVAAATMEAVSAAPLGGIAGAVESPAPIKTLAEENLEQTNEIARKVAGNGAPLTASVIQDQAATDLRQYELAKQLSDDLNVDREVKAETQTATTKEEVAANLSEEDLNKREQDAKKLVQQYKDAYFESQDPNDRAKAVEFQGVLDAIQAEKQKRKAAPTEAAEPRNASVIQGLSEEDLNAYEQDLNNQIEQKTNAYNESFNAFDISEIDQLKSWLNETQVEKRKRSYEKGRSAPTQQQDVTTPTAEEVVTPTTGTEVIPLRDAIIQSGIPEEAADIYIDNLKSEGINEDQIREIADNNKSLREEAARKNEEESIAKRDLAQRARMGDKEARAQLEGERGILTTPTTEDITAVPPVAEAATLPVEQAPLTQQAVAQPIEKQSYATQEIIQPEGIRQEPQDGTQIQPTTETIVSDSVLSPATSQEEGQVIPTSTAEQETLLGEAKSRYDSEIATYKNQRKLNLINDQELGKKLKAAGMQFSAEKRKVTGQLTDKEFEAEAKRKASNYIGKPVEVDGKLGKVVGNPFGRVKVKLDDGGTIITTTSDKVTDRLVAEEGGQVSEITTAPTIGEEPQVSPEIENLIQRAESAATREEAAQIGSDFAELDPSIPPPPSAEYEIVKAISDKANRRPYNADVLTEENITAAKEAGLVTKTKVPKLTESGRSLVTDGARVARDREMAIGDITDRIIDQTVSAWDAKNNPNSFSFKARIAAQPTPTPVTEQAAPAEAPAPEVGDIVAVDRKNNTEFALVKGLLPERPDMFSIGIRLIGSNQPFESGGYGHNTNKDSVMKRFFEKERRNLQDIEIKNQYFQNILNEEEGRVSAVEAKESEKKQQEQEKQRQFNEEKVAYEDAISQVKIPTGKSETMRFTAPDGSDQAFESKRYGDVGIRKVTSGKNALYNVDHWHSGLRIMQFNSLSEAKKFTQAIIASGADISKKDIQESELEKLRPIARYFRSGEVVPSLPSQLTPTPVVSEAITPATPAGLQVGQRVRSGSTPQPFVITEVTPQTARDVELGEQYYKIKNERTGEVSVVESVDITPVKTTRSSKKLKSVYPSRGGVEPTGAIQAKAGVSPAIDTEYLAAVERGDMETAQRMVDEAAKEAGYTFGPVYHGTKKEFSVFDIGKSERRDEGESGEGFYFATNKKLAGLYAQDSTGLGKERVISAYLKMENPLKDDWRIIARGKNNEILHGKQISDRAKELGHDGIIALLPDGKVYEIVAFDSNQIKSADPVTYDEQGNVIPLSQRFNKKTPDIRYARARDKAKYRQKYKSIAIQAKVQNYIKIAQDEMQEAIDNKDIELAENIQKNINTAFQYNINESELYTQEDLVKGVANFFNGSIPDNVIFVEDIGFNGYALYNTETGQIEINRAYFKEGKKIDSIIAHELGHYAFGDPVFRQAILDLWNGLTPQAREAISRFVEKNYSDFDPDSRTEEKIIYGWEQIIEANPEVKSSWDKFVQFINYYLNKYIFRGQYVPKNSTKVALDVLNSIRQEFINGKSIIREDGSRFTFEARVTEDRSQVHGQKQAGRILNSFIGGNKIVQDIVRQNYFDSTQFNDENTQRAYDLLQSLIDFTDGNNNDFAIKLNEDIQSKLKDYDVDPDIKQVIGVQILRNELQMYSNKLTIAGDSFFDNIYKLNANDIPLGIKDVTSSNIARALAAIAKINNPMIGAIQAQGKGEIVQLASTTFGTKEPSTEQIDAIEEALKESGKAETIDNADILDSVVSAESKTGVNIRKDIDATIKKSGVKQKTVDDVIGSTETGKTEFAGVDASTAKASIKKQATSPIDAQAERAIEGLAKLQSDVQAWPNKTQNQVRSIVQQDLRQRPDMARKEAWKSLLTSKLMNAGVSESNAMTLSDLIWKQHEINNMNREIKLIESAAENGSLGVIIEMIKNTPLQQQSTPEWRKEVIRQYLMSAGLSEKQAESAARLYDNIIAEKIAEAKQKAFEQSISKTSPWRDHMSRNGQLAKDALKKVLNAVRTSALDPTQNTESIIAKQNGWTGFSEADFRRIAEIDEILNNKETDDLKKAELMKELNEIISKTKLPVTVKQALAAFYTGQALMGIPTVTVNVFSPLGFSLRNLVTDIGRFAVTDPTRIPLAFDTFLDSMRSWYNQTKYAFKNEVYPNDVVEYLNGNNVLKELYNKGKKEWKNGEYGSGMRDMLVGMTQITGRVLSALDQGAISALENQAVNRYAMEAMSLSNIPRSKRNAVARQILQAKRNTYASLIAGGMEKERAGVLADMEMKNEIKKQLSSLNIESEKVNNVINSALNDALLSVGRNRTISMDGLTNEQKRLSDDGMISYLPIKFLEQIASSSAQQGPLMQVFSKMLYGFALVPARAFHNAAWYSPYGFLRIFRDKYQKSKGMESSYSLSLGNELQYRQRLTESIAGSLVMLGLGALVKSSTDDEDDDKFKIVVTGNGPDAAADKQYYDSWIKKWKPYSIHIVMGDTVIPINIGRGGEAIFFPILIAGALDDWNIRNQMNKAKKKPADLNQATVMLGSAFLALAQRGPYAAFGKSLFNANRAGQLPEEVAAQAGYFGKTFVPILGTSLARNISDFINDPIDRSSMSGAIYSNIPIVGPMIGTKALNAFGQPMRADDWGDKLYKLGVPMVFSFPKNTPMNELNELVLSKGDGPTIPTRRTAEARLERPMTNEEFYAYVKTYGDYVSKRMFRSRKSLERMDASRYQSQLEEYSQDASERATRAVKRMSIE